MERDYEDITLEHGPDIVAAQRVVFEKAAILVDKLKLMNHLVDLETQTFKAGSCKQQLKLLEANTDISFALQRYLSALDALQREHDEEEIEKQYREFLYSSDKGVKL